MSRYPCRKDRIWNGGEGAVTPAGGKPIYLVIPVVEIVSEWFCFPKEKTLAISCKVVSLDSKDDKTQRKWWWNPNCHSIKSSLGFCDWSVTPFVNAEGSLDLGGGWYTLLPSPFQVALSLLHSSFLNICGSLRRGGRGNRHNRLEASVSVLSDVLVIFYNLIRLIAEQGNESVTYKIGLLGAWKAFQHKVFHKTVSFVVKEWIFSFLLSERNADQA